MKVYKNAIIATGIITLISFLASFIFNFYTQVNSFWCNALLGIFGSSLLTLLTSTIGYRVERRKTFEGFSYATKEILHALNKYQVSWSLEEKIDFFLNYHDISKIEWDRYYGDFSFIADFRGKNRRYIYEQIYTPILRVNQAINNHVWHFRYYKDGSGKNDKVLGKSIEEIEALFIETTISEIDTNEKGDPVTMTSTKNKIVHTIQEELNEKYYQLMYGKKTYISSNQSLS